jgi:predicted dinucleotide-binding enzyme
MNIGILGSGVVGQTLGAGLAALGHKVKLGSRDPHSDKIQTWVESAGSNASSGTFAETAKFADIAILATLWSGTENALLLALPESLAGKALIDATNPLDFSSGSPRLAIGHTDSGGEQVQRWLPATHVVKAFNTVGAPHMVNPNFPGGPPDMFLCGNDASAKATVTEICETLGWPTIDIGDITGARLLEPMCILWVDYGIRTGTWTHAFKLLRK